MWVEATAPPRGDRAGQVRHSQDTASWFLRITQPDSKSQHLTMNYPAPYIPVSRTLPTVVTPRTKPPPEPRSNVTGPTRPNATGKFVLMVPRSVLNSTCAEQSWGTSSSMFPLTLRTSSVCPCQWSPAALTVMLPFTPRPRTSPPARTIDTLPLTELNSIAPCTSLTVMLPFTDAS